ncbi:MAG: hypothetical protein HQL37_01475 [Alphaproteobacteria bacterium]|nr:hypothetical protein [Alphaproteobacteria bacterium]
MAALNSKLLVVEGEDDKYAVIHLMQAHVDLGDKESDRKVNIEVAKGVDKIFKIEFISVRLKLNDILGIVIDADEDFASRWSGLRKLCLVDFPNLPEELPERGLVAQNEDGKRLGVWIMPDNKSRGMLETFLQFLVPESEEPIWQEAQCAVVEAKAIGAKCHAPHMDKANVYTWMAWQDPPGQSFGRALMQKILDPHANSAKPFIAWFRELFEI